MIFALVVALAVAANSSAATITPLLNAGGGVVGPPTALAFDAQGRLFIADGNRVLVAAPNEPPALFAGAASGKAGYADGRAEQARFNDPSGLAFGSRGELYVADTGNHLIRVIAPTGIVSTYAGTPNGGRVDGPLTRAAFVAPVGIATDERGDVFVADRGTGIREITVQGEVVTLPLSVHDATAVAVGESFTLFASDADGIVAARLSDGHARRIPSARRVGPGVEKLQGEHPLGTPLALAAVDSSSVLYTTADGAVRYLDVDQLFTRKVAGGPPLADPVALALAPNGGVAVAEASGAVDLVTNINLRKPIAPSDVGLLPNHFTLNPSAYNIAYVGSSFVWWDTDWDDSIQGVLENELLREPNGPRRKPRVIPVIMPGGTLQACEEYSRFLGDLGVVPLVVLDVSRTQVAQSFSVSLQTIAFDRATWEPRLIGDLTNLKRDLAADHAQLLVVVHPEEPDMVGQAEGIPFLADDLREHGVRAINLYPAFGRASGSAQLFNSAGPHFSAAGRRLEADAVAREIESAPPWVAAQASPTQSPRPENTAEQRPSAGPRGTPHPVVKIAASALSRGPKQAAARGVAVPTKPRFFDAWASLNSALWMLTHTSGVRASDGDYQLATRAIYAAIGALDDGITTSTRKPEEPVNPPNDLARVRAALNLLDGADNDLTPHSMDRIAEPLRVRALGATQRARTAVERLVHACGC